MYMPVISTAELSVGSLTACNLSQTWLNVLKRDQRILILLLCAQGTPSADLDRRARDVPAMEQTTYKEWSDWEDRNTADLGDGWRMIAKFSGGTQRWQPYYSFWDREREGGFYLAARAADAAVALYKYDSHDGLCSLCSYGVLDSEGGIEQAQDGKPLLRLGFEEMLKYAEEFIDPCMTARTLQAKDEHYAAITTLYDAYKRWWAAGPMPGQSTMTENMQTLGQEGVQEPKDLNKACECWTSAQYNGVVKLQPRVRGALLRKHLHSPYTELDKRRLMLQWSAMRGGS